MKKIIIMMGLAAVLGLGSCAGKDSAAEASAAGQASKVEQAATDAVAAGSVVDLADDTIYRPGMKPEQLIVLDFNATWCGPCKQLKPVFDKIAGVYNGLRFVSVDVDRNPRTAEAFGIEAVPTVVFLKPDGSMEKFTGTEDLMPYDKFAALIEKAL